MAFVDVGVCHLEGLDGKTLQRTFVNVLGLGYDASVVERIQCQHRRRVGSMTCLASALREIMWLRTYRLKGEIDGVPFETLTFLFAVGLGRYFGRSMMITPGASPQAGRFQLVWADDLGRLAVLRLLQKTYSRQHMNHLRVHTLYGRYLRLNSRPQAHVQAEGELIGRTPIEIELHPRTLPLAVGSAKPAVNGHK